MTILFVFYKEEYNNIIVERVNPKFPGINIQLEINAHRQRERISYIDYYYNLCIILASN